MTERQRPRRPLLPVEPRRRRSPTTTTHRLPPTRSRSGSRPRLDVPPRCDFDREPSVRPRRARATPTRHPLPRLLRQHTFCPHLPLPHPRFMPRTPLLPLHRRPRVSRQRRRLQPRQSTEAILPLRPRVQPIEQRRSTRTHLARSMASHLLPVHSIRRTAPRLPPPPRGRLKAPRLPRLPRSPHSPPPRPSLPMPPHCWPPIPSPPRPRLMRATHSMHRIGWSSLR